MSPSIGASKNTVFHSPQVTQESSIDLSQPHLATISPPATPSTSPDSAPLIKCQPEIAILSLSSSWPPLSMPISQSSDQFNKMKFSWGVLHPTASPPPCPRDSMSALPHQNQPPQAAASSSFADGYDMAQIRTSKSSKEIVTSKGQKAEELPKSILPSFAASHPDSEGFLPRPPSPFDDPEAFQKYEEWEHEQKEESEDENPLRLKYERWSYLRRNEEDNDDDESLPLFMKKELPKRERRLETSLVVVSK